VLTTLAWKKSIPLDSRYRGAFYPYWFAPEVSHTCGLVVARVINTTNFRLGGRFIENIVQVMPCRVEEIHAICIPGPVARALFWRTIMPILMNAIPKQHGNRCFVRVEDSVAQMAADFWSPLDLYPTASSRNLKYERFHDWQRERVLYETEQDKVYFQF